MCFCGRNHLVSLHKHPITTPNSLFKTDRSHGTLLFTIRHHSIRLLTTRHLSRPRKLITLGHQGASPFTMGGGYKIPHRHATTSQQPTSEPEWNKCLWGLVDMGSNGIRLSITDQSAPTTRVLPTVYAYRNKISLYEAQYDENGTKIPISAAVMDDVISMLLRFQIFCADFRVPPE